MLDAPLHATERALKKAGCRSTTSTCSRSTSLRLGADGVAEDHRADPARLNVKAGHRARPFPGGSGTKLMTR